MAYQKGYGISVTSTGNRDNDNSNVCAVYDESLTRVFIRGTYSAGAAQGYQNNTCRYVVIGS